MDKVEKGRKNMKGMVWIVINRMIEEEKEIRILRLEKEIKKIGKEKRIKSLIGIEKNGEVRKNGKWGEKSLMRMWREKRKREDLSKIERLIKKDRLLKRDIVEGVYRNIKIRKIEEWKVKIKKDIEVVIEKKFEWEKEFNKRLNIKWIWKKNMKK